jgi:hypothetical protein
MAGVILKGVAVLTVPNGELTVISPVMAPAGAVTVIDDADFDVMAAVAPPANCTLVTTSSSVPVKVTAVPTGPRVGAIDAIVGLGVLVTVS